MFNECIHTDINFESTKEIERLVEFSQLLPGLVAYKGLDSTFLFASDRAAKIMGYRDAYDIIGRGIKDSDMRCSAAELAEQFVLEDKRVIRERRPIRLLEVLCYADDGWRVMLGEKFPVMDKQGNPKAVGCYLTDITHTNLSILNHDLFAADIKRYGKKKKQISYLMDVDTDTRKLTVKQKQVIFYLLRGGTARSIADRMCLSMHTVNDHIENLKCKFACVSKSQLVERLINLGFLNHFPH